MFRFFPRKKLTTKSLWAAYYFDDEKVDAFSPYQLMILDPDSHIELKQIKKINPLLGYVSLGEINFNSVDYSSVESQSIIIGKNKDWSGSLIIDIRTEAWRDHLLKNTIPNILAQGFDGIFLDTLESPFVFENKEPIKYRGMTQAAIILVKQIRQQFPNIVIMLNRCFELISSLETDIDMLLAESIYTTYDFYHERYSHQPVNVYEEISEQLKQFKKNNKQVDIFTLDYWDQTDHQSINDIYTTQRNMGFIPYVSTVLLDQLYVQPKIIS